MNPHTYAALYGPHQPTERPRRGQVAVAVLAGLLWVVTLASLAWLTFLVSMAAVWATADGQPAEGFVLRFVLTVVGAAATLAALARSPGIRRLEPAARLLLLGALACPVPAVLAICAWVQVG